MQPPRRGQPDDPATHHRHVRHTAIVQGTPPRRIRRTCRLLEKCLTGLDADRLLGQLAAVLTSYDREDPARARPR
ncbi:hypothetical protein JCM9534A_81590 [Catenuloplanes indicus JCM 9534]